MAAEVPPPAELRSMKMKALRALCKEMGVSETEEEELEVRGEPKYFIEWIERHRPAPLVVIPPPSELWDMRLDDLEKLCKELGMSAEEEDKVEGKEACIAWIEQRRPAPVVVIPPPSELWDMRLDDLEKLCKELGMSAEEEDKVEGKEACIAWIEQRRPAASRLEKLRPAALAAPTTTKVLYRPGMKPTGPRPSAPTPAVLVPSSPVPTSLVPGSPVPTSQPSAQQPGAQQPSGRQPSGCHPNGPLQLSRYPQREAFGSKSAASSADSARATPPPRESFGTRSMPSTGTTEPSCRYDAQQHSSPPRSSDAASSSTSTSHKDHLEAEKVTEVRPSWSEVAKTAAPSRARSPAREEEKIRKEKETTGKAAAQPTAPQQSAAGDEEGKRQGKEKGDAKGETGEVVVSMMKYYKGGRFVPTHEVGECRKFKFNRKGMPCQEQEPLYVQGKVVVRTVKEYEEFREWVGRNPHVHNVPKEFKGADSKEPGRYCQLKMHVWREKDGEHPAVCFSVFVLERVTEGTRKDLEATEGGKDFKRPQEVFEACWRTANTSLFYTMDPLCWSGPLKEWSSGAATVTYREEARSRKQGTGSRELVVHVDESNKKRLQELKVKKDAALKAKAAAQGSKKGFQKVGK